MIKIEELIRESVRRIIESESEQEEDISSANILIEPDIEQIDSDDAQLAADKFNRTSSWIGKAREILKILSLEEFLGDDAEKIIGADASYRLMRFGLKAKSDERHNILEVISNLYQILSPSSSQDTIQVLGPNEGDNPSAKYTAYKLGDLDILILFGIAGTLGGQRKQGYIYEKDTMDGLTAILPATEGGSSNAVSDIYVPTKTMSGQSGLGIEVKLPNAQAGEPTLAYDFDLSIEDAPGVGGFIATNPKPQNEDIANLINSDPSRTSVNARLRLVRDAISKYRKSIGESEIDQIRKISRYEYENIVQPVLDQNTIKYVVPAEDEDKEGAEVEVKGKVLAVYTVTAGLLRTYYMLKKAGLVQVKGYGLYHLHPDFQISLGDGRDTKLFEFPPASGAVYFRNFRGNNYGIRSQFSQKPLTKLKKSGIDLDREDDRRDFASLVNTRDFPDPKNLAKQANSDPKNLAKQTNSGTLSEALRIIIGSIL